MEPSRAMTSLASELQSRLTDRTAAVGVVGLGYVGLPLLVELARAGYEAVGFDLDERKVAAISEGRSYIPDVATADVSRLVAAGRTEAEALGHLADAARRFGVASADTEPRYIPHPSTWLNDGRYDDEPDDDAEPTAEQVREFNIQLGMQFGRTREEVEADMAAAANGNSR